jgi:hypothetical protein
VCIVRSNGTRIEVELAQLRPVEAVDLTQTAEQFRASSGVLAESMHQDRKLFFQAALDEVVVKKKL